MAAVDLSVRERTFTTTEFRRMVAAGVFESDENIELIEGHLVVMPPQGPLHSATTRLLVEMLLTLGFPIGQVFDEKPIRLEPDSECVPDITLVAPNPADPRFRDEHPTPEYIQLVIEVANSTLAFDLDTKTRVYARAGIREYWVVDLKGRRLVCHTRPVDGEYREQQSLVAGCGARAALPEGKTLDIDALFAL